MFKILSKCGNARVGILETNHGKIETPIFLPVATKSSVKTLDSRDLEYLKIKALITNAFLLYLKPGVEIIEEAGGLHEFMNFYNTIFTDSGGFQIIREGFVFKIRDDGIIFRSPFDNSKHFLSPEKVVEIQKRLGSDVAMVLDYCPEYTLDRKIIEKATKLTTKWAERSKKYYEKVEFNGLLFGIVQGGVFKDLREKSVKEILEIDFDGYAIGGLSIGEPKDIMLEIVSYTANLLPEKKPRYFMGLGSPVEILECISRGVDIFDSAFPTRNARHGTAYTYSGKISLNKGRYRKDFSPIDESCKCFVCENYSRAYIHHLLKVREYSGMRLITIHNLFFLNDLFEKCRYYIKKGKFEEFKHEFIKKFSSQNLQEPKE